MSQLEVDKIIPQSGTTLTIGDSGDTITFGTGTTPQLGGDLDLNSNDITGTGNINITGTATVSGDLTVDTDTLYVDSSNNRVGVGTTSPSTALDVAGTVTSDGLQVGAASDGAIISVDGSVTELTLGGVGSGSRLFTEYDRSTGAALFKEGTVGSENAILKLNNNGDISFYEDTGTTPKFFWDASAESLGIGTSSPSARLNIQSSASGTYLINLDYTNGTDGGGFFESGGDGMSLLLKDPSGNVDVSLSSDGDSYFTGGNVGIGTSSPATHLHVVGGMRQQRPGGNSFEWAISSGGNYFLTDITNSTERVRITSSGNVGIGTTSPSEKLDVSGNVTISGSLSKGSGSFKIDHPLPEKTDTHHLVHSFVEAPQADNIYRGKVDLVNGTATVNIDTVAGMSEGTFILLNREIQCFTSNETGWTAVKGSVSENILTITAQDETCTDTISWLVIGERQDQHMYDTEWTDENGKVIVEPLKPVEEETIE